jgi:hypothetical protein
MRKTTGNHIKRERVVRESDEIRTDNLSYRSFRDIVFLIRLSEL